MAPRMSATLFVAGLGLTLATLAAPPLVEAQGRARRENFAQSVLRDVMRRHPQLIGLELSARRGNGCITVAATDAGDIGHRCDAGEREMLRAGEPQVDEPSAADPAYVISEPLLDAAGEVMGLIIMDIRPERGGRAAALGRARAVRLDVQSRIRSAAQLSGGAPAAEAPPPSDASYEPRLDASTFGRAVTNPYFPLVPGTVFRFRGTGGASAESTVVTVTSDTRVVNGIPATVVRDQVFRAGELIEDTYDWYAQDGEGNVWYLGEDTKEFRNGRVQSTQGSWEAGVGGAKPGIIMWANPGAHIGKRYRQEYLPGEAEDWGKVLAVSESVVVPYGRFEGCVKTEDTTPLEPNVLEHKYYCRGIGVVKEVESRGEGMELVAVERR
jgi:hypothetical protein